MAGFDSQTMALAHNWFLSKFSRLPPCAHAGYVLRFINCFYVPGHGFLELAHIAHWQYPRVAKEQLVLPIWS
jgi:hypothetical protein